MVGPEIPLRWERKTLVWSDSFGDNPANPPYPGTTEPSTWPNGLPFADGALNRCNHECSEGLCSSGSYMKPSCWDLCIKATRKHQNAEWLLEFAECEDTSHQKAKAVCMDPNCSEQRKMTCGPQLGLVIEI